MWDGGLSWGREVLMPEWMYLQNEGVRWAEQTWKPRGRSQSADAATPWRPASHLPETQFLTCKVEMTSLPQASGIQVAVSTWHRHTGCSLKVGILPASSACTSPNAMKWDHAAACLIPAPSTVPGTWERLRKCVQNGREKFSAELWVGMYSLCCWGKENQSFSWHSLHWHIDCYIVASALLGNYVYKLIRWWSVPASSHFSC